MRKSALKISIALFGVLLFSVAARAQNVCLTKAETESVVARIDAGQTAPKNNAVRRELLKMRETRARLEERLLEPKADLPALLVERDKLGRAHLSRVCRIIAENGFPTDETAEPVGFEAMFYLIANNRAFDLQAEMLTVLAAAANKGLLKRNYVAPIVDNIRVGRNLPQIFGTQAAIRNGVVYLYPLLNENRVDEWRKNYNMPPLAASIRDLERRYLMPVLKTSRPARLAPAAEKKANAADAAILGVDADETEVLEVTTKLVNLNVQVLRKEFATAADAALTQDDFAVYENGREQKIKFFSNVEKPFDLILLLDFSGSTIKVQGLIKKAAERFVEIARPTDRIAVVGFTDELFVAADLTSDRDKLRDAIRRINITGGSHIWDSLDYVYREIIAEQSQGRRSAVIMMTDALDSSADTTFADVMETVRQNDTTIYAVHLNTNYYQQERANSMTEKAMSLLAEASGGRVYPVKKIKDLTGAYEQVAKDLSRVYSIGYEPADSVRDGAWRELRVEIKSHPELIAHTRQGYYAN